MYESDKKIPNDVAAELEKLPGQMEKAFSDPDNTRLQKRRPLPAENRPSCHSGWGDRQLGLHGHHASSKNAELHVLQHAGVS